jgi:hypothetical protein
LGFTPSHLVIRVSNDRTGQGIQIIGQRLRWSRGPSTQTIQTRIHHNPMQPRGDRRLATKLICASVGGDQCFLQCICSVFRVSCRAEGNAPETIFVPTHQNSEGIRISGHVGCEQLSIGQIWVNHIGSLLAGGGRPVAHSHAAHTALVLPRCVRGRGETREPHQHISRGDRLRYS